MNSTAAASPARRLLLLNSPPPAAAATNPESTDSKFDATVVLVFSILLCALIFALAVNSIVRCALRCSRPATAADRISSAAKVANTGVKKKALKNFPTATFSEELKLKFPGLDAECAICLSDFAAGEVVKILPTCNHGFHVSCIDKWLGSHSSCPTCRHCLILDSSRKVAVSPAPVEAAAVSSPSFTAPEDSPSMSAGPAGGVVISMPPLEAEGPVRGQRIKSLLFWRKN